MFDSSPHEGAAECSSWHREDVNYQTGEVDMEISLEDPSVPRKRLARLRCLRESITCFRRNEPLPTALCYVPSQLENIVTRKAQISLFSEPDKKSKKPQVSTYLSGSSILTSGERVCNDQGLWAKLIEVEIQLASLI